MYHGYIDLPSFEYFQFGNIWTGSVFEKFNYRIIPPEDDQPPVLKTEIWYGRLSSEKSETAESFTEELSPQGYDLTIEKLNSKIEEYYKSVNGMTSAESKS